MPISDLYTSSKIGFKGNVSVRHSIAANSCRSISIVSEYQYYKNKMENTKIKRSTNYFQHFFDCSLQCQ